MTPNPHLDSCPHCQSDAGVRPSADYRYKCHLCGKPRIPLDARVTKTSESTRRFLQQAHRARVARIAWQVLGVLGVGVGAFFMLMALGLSALFDFGGIGTTAALFVVLIPVLASVLSFVSAKRAKQKGEIAIEDAWRDATARLYRVLEGRLSSKQLADMTGIDEEYATTLLAEAEVQQLLAPPDAGLDPVKVRIREEGDLSAEEWDEAERALGNVPTQAMRARKE